MAIDSSKTAPASRFADNSWLVPRCASPSFVASVLELCKRERIDLVIPTIDPELPVYAAIAARLAEAGTTVCISSAETVGIGADKLSLIHI